MELNIDTGVEEFRVNGRGVLRFNPADPNLYHRFFAAGAELDGYDAALTKALAALDGDEQQRAAAGLALLNEYDGKIKKLLTGIFGAENDFDAILGGVNLAGVGANGKRVVQNLLEALTPILREGAAEGIDNEQALVAQLLLGDVLHGRPGLLGHGVVVVLVLVGSPPNGVLGVLVHDDVLVLRRTAGVDAGHNVDSIQFGLLAHFVTGEAGLGLFLVEHLVGRIVDDFRGAGNAVLFNSVSFHDGVPPIIYGVKNERQKPRFQHILVNTLESPKFHQIHINTPLPESKQDFR